MRISFLSLAAGVALLTSCASSIDEYHYGYAPAYRTLPPEFAQVDIGGTPYWHHGGRFYQHDPERGYLLVKPPRGSEHIVAAASGASSPAPAGTPVAAAPQQTGGTGNPLRQLFTSGGGSVEGMKPMKRGGNHVIRR